MQALLEWHLDLKFQVAGSDTRAAALLRLPDDTELTAQGQAHRRPDDPMQLRVGEELAAARALNGLARQLLAKAAREIEEVTHTPARPNM